MSREQYERGTILDVLKANRGLEISIAFMQLLQTLHNLTLPLSPYKLRENLEYMAAKEYVAITRRSDVPGYRTSRSLKGDESPDHIVTVKLTAKGMDLLQGSIEADPGVVT